MSKDRSDPSLAYTIPFQLTPTIHRSVPAELSPTKPSTKESAKGKIIVISGGSRGIGLAAARVWVQAGAAGVVIAGRSKETLDKAIVQLEQLKEGSTSTTILAVPTDVAKEKDTEALFDKVKKTFGRSADVVLANAGALSGELKPHEDTVSNWWHVYEVNVLGTHNLAVSFIRSQPKPDSPVGTFINVNSGLAGMLVPGISAYSTSKLAAQRYVEYLHIEYPTLRVFTLFPGIVLTDMVAEAFVPFAKDEAEQTGALALYLASSRAEYLRGSLTSVNWDVGEMEGHKEEIEKGLLKISWVPVLPASGGNGI